MLCRIFSLKYFEISLTAIGKSPIHLVTETIKFVIKNFYYEKLFSIYFKYLFVL